MSFCGVPHAGEAYGLTADVTARLVMAFLALAAATVLHFVSAGKTADGSDVTLPKFLIDTFFAIYPFVIVNAILGFWYAVVSVILWAVLVTPLHTKLMRV